MTKQIIEIKRAYDPASEDDGFRVYVDGLWPRGLSHETFHYDLWDKEISPSAELREWFHEDPDKRWNEFTNRYFNELKSNDAAARLRDTIIGKPKITLLYSSHDRDHNNAVVLQRFLEE
ncbi:MAG: DUF488 family protein [Muribaculaceae bacterium]|nr:DUF488 family protein [Muribaculaceae bacterium]